MAAAPVVTPTGLEVARETLADVLERLGSVPPHRVLYPPAPGTATEADLLAALAEEKVCELVDGTLVEKAMGYYESVLALALAGKLREYLSENDLGVLSGEAGTMRLAPGQVRAPDVGYVSWDRFPNRRIPREPLPPVAPDLAVEVLSSSNTEAEMRRKVREFFAAGTRLVWLVDPRSRTARVFIGPEVFTTIPPEGALDGGEVLPGFRLSLPEWFAKAGRVEE